MARLIIVEDNNELASLIASAARARGHEAKAVHSGNAALQALGQSAFDAGVVDLLLPDLSGNEVLDALRQRGVTTVAMSGVYKGESFAREAVEEHGAFRFFEKPFDMRALMEAVEAALGTPLPAELIEDEEDLAELEILTPLAEDEHGDEPLIAPEGVAVELSDEPPTRPELESGHEHEEQELASELLQEMEPELPPAVESEAAPEPASELTPELASALVPQLDDEPGTPTRPLDEAELAMLAKTSEEEALASPSPEVVDDVEEEIPTRVAGLPLDLRSPEAKTAEAAEMEDEFFQALEALEALGTPIDQGDPPPAAPPPPVAAPPPLPRPARGPGGAVGMAHELAVRVSHTPPPPPPVPVPAPPPADESSFDSLESFDLSQPSPSEPEPPPSPEPEPEPQPGPPASPEPSSPEAEAPAPDVVHLPFAERGRVWRKPDHPVRKHDPLPEWSESGELSQATSVPKLLNAFYAARHTGELKLKQDTVTKVIYVEDGQPVYAASNLASERFGRFCVRRGAIAEADLNRVAALSDLEGIRTGEAMVRLGLLASDRRRELLEDQVREIIWSTFSWTRGQYSTVARKPSRMDLVKLLLFPGELILEGVQRTYSLLSLRQKMPAGRRLFPALDPPYLQQDLQLIAPQAHLLSQADGSKTVEDLLSLTDLSERDALAALAGFELLGLLVERREETKTKRQRISFGI